MRILIGCEESQAVCSAFRERGHDAYSCDIQPCSGIYPQYHYQRDIFDVINEGWDMLIGHPPCTYLTVTANKWLKDQPERVSGKLVGEKRRQAREGAIDFFMKLWEAPIPKICLENPVGAINSRLRPNQIIQPYYFGDEAQKTTCLWLKNLPPLFHARQVDLFNQDVTHVGKGEMVVFKSGNVMPKWYAENTCAKNRSKTFPGIARAMAKQWG